MTATPCDDSNPTLCWRAWCQAAGDAGVDAGIKALYARVGQEIETRGPVCWASGRCCHFETFGHRLYVTGLEIAWMLEKLKTEGIMPGLRQVDVEGDCPFQIDHLCTVHNIRPLGCRLFFCQQGSESWQHDLYEQFLGDLRVLHETHNLPYRYMEWRGGVREAWQMLEADD